MTLKTKKCIEQNCNTLPIFNYQNEKVGLYCKKHALDGMVDVKNNKCLKINCTTQPIFNYPDQIIGLYCKKHALDGMVDVKHKNCIEIGCVKRSCFNYFGEPNGLYCREHSLDGMINVVDKKCIVDECLTRASYNIFGQPPKYCAKHKTSKSILNPTPQCKFKGCTTLATYGISKTPEHCEYHSTLDEYDMFSKPCISCKLENILNENGKCYFCDPCNILKYQHAKELRVKKSLDLLGIVYDQHDKVIDGGKYGKERPDFLFLTDSHAVIVEVDENQHSERPCECEQIRMMNISQSLRKPTIFIRYNPDSYKKDRELIKDIHENHDKRMNVLIEAIIKYKDIIPDAFLSVTYLFFDGWNNTYKLTTIMENEKCRPKPNVKIIIKKKI